MITSVHLASLVHELVIELSIRERKRQPWLALKGRQRSDHLRQLWRNGNKFLIAGSNREARLWNLATLVNRVSLKLNVMILQ